MSTTSCDGHLIPAPGTSHQHVRADEVGGSAGLPAEELRHLLGDHAACRRLYLVRTMLMKEVCLSSCASFECSQFEANRAEHGRTFLRHPHDRVATVNGVRVERADSGDNLLYQLALLNGARVPAIAPI